MLVWGACRAANKMCTPPWAAAGAVDRRCRAWPVGKKAIVGSSQGVGAAGWGTGVDWAWGYIVWVYLALEVGIFLSLCNSRLSNIDPVSELFGPR